MTVSPRALVLPVLATLAACGSPKPPAAPALDLTDASAPAPAGSATLSGPIFYDAAEPPPGAPSLASPNGRRREFATQDEASLDAMRSSTVPGGWADATFSDPKASGLSPQAITLAQRPLHPDLDACMDRFVRTRRSFSGRIGFAIDVDAQGHAENVTLDEDQIGGEALARCLEPVLRAVAWPAPPGQAATSFRFGLYLFSRVSDRGGTMSI